MELTSLLKISLGHICADGSERGNNTTVRLSGPSGVKLIAYGHMTYSTLYLDN